MLGMMMNNNNDDNDNHSNKISALNNTLWKPKSLPVMSKFLQQG